VRWWGMMGWVVSGCRGVREPEGEGRGVGGLLERGHFDVKSNVKKFKRLCWRPLVIKRLIVTGPFCFENPRLWGTLAKNGCLFPRHPSRLVPCPGGNRLSTALRLAWL